MNRPDYYILVYRNLDSHGWGWAVFKPGVPIRPERRWPWDGSERWGIGCLTKTTARFAGRRAAKRLCRPTADHNIESYNCKPTC